MALHYAENITHFDFVKGTLQLILCGKEDLILFFAVVVVENVGNSLVIVRNTNLVYIMLHKSCIFYSVWLSFLDIHKFIDGNWKSFPSHNVILLLFALYLFAVFFAQIKFSRLFRVRELFFNGSLLFTKRLCVNINRNLYFLK